MLVAMSKRGMTQPISLDINGKAYSLEADPNEPLALAQRNRLGLTDVKVGCGLEQCGACAVFVDGNSVLSCVRPATGFAGQEIETVEGPGGPERPGPVRQALIDVGVVQCGS